MIEFPSSSVDGIASPVFRTNNGFVGGGQTAGGSSRVCDSKRPDSNWSNSMDSTLMNIQPTETKIAGNWVFENGKLVAGSAAKRIDHLIKNELMEIGRSDDGWSVLYLDKTDGRYWELNYPDSSQHGGGAPCLELLSRENATEKYKISS